MIIVEKYKRVIVNSVAIICLLGVAIYASLLSQRYGDVANISVNFVIVALFGFLAIFFNHKIFIVLIALALAAAKIFGWWPA